MPSNFGIISSSIRRESGIPTVLDILTVDVFYTIGTGTIPYGNSTTAINGEQLTVNLPANATNIYANITGTLLKAGGDFGPVENQYLNFSVGNSFTYLNEYLTDANGQATATVGISDWSDISAISNINKIRAYFDGAPGFLASNPELTTITIVESAT